MTKKTVYMLNISFRDAAFCSEPQGKNSFFSPPVDVYEDEGGVFIEIELPGVKSEEIKVLIDKETLIVKGHKVLHKKEGELQYYLLERPSGYFYEEIYINDFVDKDKIEASFKDGVLLITMPYKHTQNEGVLS